jgi:hypothetical protein
MCQRGASAKFPAVGPAGERVLRCNYSPADVFQEQRSVIALPCNSRKTRRVHQSNIAAQDKSGVPDEPVEKFIEDIRLLAEERCALVSDVSLNSDRPPALSLA